MSISVFDLLILVACKIVSKNEGQYNFTKTETKNNNDGNILNKNKFIITVSYIGVLVRIFLGKYSLFWLVMMFLILIFIF